MKNIEIRGARTHNLQNVNIDIPRDQLVVITGLSGSGKSSLAFDTLYAEGQRRYVESLSTYARQFLSVMEKPDVDQIDGLSPAIAIEQKSTSHNPRSTVGTVTEIYDYLRLLFARVGQPRCPKHNIDLQAQSVSQMVDQIMLHPKDTKIVILAPIVVNRKGSHSVKLSELLQLGYLRVRIDGEIFELDDLPAIDAKKKHSIEVVVDRLKVNPSNRHRFIDSIETSLSLAQDIVIVSLLDSKKDFVFSAKFACPHCGWALSELEPRIFSFNSPQGACEDCDGLGLMQFMDPDKVIYNDSLSLNAGAICGWDRNHNYYYSMLLSLAKHYDFSLDIPFKKLKKKIREIILYGSGDEIINFSFQFEQNKIKNRKQVFPGILPYMERRYRETDSDSIREDLANFLSQQSCVSCDGSRLNESARQVFIEGINLPSITRLSIQQAKDFLAAIRFSDFRAKVAKKILKELNARLGFLIDVGLEYLSLNRTADTLSGGESQRIRLASQIGSGLVGVMYVLDEPSIGLHQRDNARLLKTLEHLRDIGNTVIVVEHDEDAILNANHVIDIGPGAGISGGKVIAAGSPKEIMQNKKSLTGKYLSGAENIEVPKKRNKPKQDKIVIKEACSNNLQNITVEIPLGIMTCVTGVSGSGKSTLINSTLYPFASEKLNGARHINHGEATEINGLEYLDKVIDITQSPIGRTPRSNAATYTGLFTDIRDIFAKTQEAMARGYQAGRFSFNVKGGRCENCRGDGLIKVEMHFLADVYVVCDLCTGKRYNNETLEIHYKGKNIHDILEMTIDMAVEFFSAIPAIKRKLNTLRDVGLGYLKLGQSATTLSGGEAQRIKLAKELSKRDTGKTLYILDEPTTGLHFHDIKRLLHVLVALQQRGNTILIIEHNLDVIKTADWIIDLGPEGGDSGGNIIATGTPETLSKNSKSYTGKFLKQVLYK